jgi:hypothetical protein
VATQTCAGRGADVQQLAPEIKLRRQRLCLRLRGADPAFQLTLGDVAQRRERSLVRRRAAGSSPVVPVSWWPWCSGSIRDCDSRGAGSNPAGHPPCGRRAPASSAGRNPVASRCGGSTPPVRTFRGCSSTGRAPRLQRGRCRFDSDRLHLASVVSTASTRPLYGRGAGSTPAGGSSRRP